jgi:hypothetical protein
MGAVDIDTALDWRGRTVLDRDGEKVGTLREIYLDEDDRPAWGSVHTGLFGLRQTFVPLGDAQATDDELRLPYDGGHIKDAPRIDPDVQLSAAEEERLFRHYGSSEPSGEQGGAVALGEAADADADPAAEAPATTEGEDAMTRSEEEVSIGKRVQPRERVRLRKYVVTDYVKRTVPVQREEIRLEHDRLPDDG